jgi:short-subunit dehydrogenase
MTDSGTNKRAIILGATSAIAERAARLWAREGAALVLVGRDAGHLAAIADDLRIRGAAVVHPVVRDLATVEARRELEEMTKLIGHVDVVLVAYGVLGDQTAAEQDFLAARRILETDFVSAADWCLAAAHALAAQRAGTLIVLGSVAGDRGRSSNYIYGAAKGGLGILVEGLAHRLAPTGARAILVKPGLVDTPMTAGFAKGALWSGPDAIAAAIRRAAERGGPVIYAPWWWRLVMLIIRLMPSWLMHRTRL